MRLLLAAMLMLPTAAIADGLTVEKPWIPSAPPKAMAHAAFMTLTNEGDLPAQIIGVSAEGYMMSHIHMSDEKDGIATMSSVDMIEIAPGQTVTLKHGGLHIMLMKPMAPKAEGDAVELTLEFADGTTQKIEAMVMKMRHGM